MNIIVQKFGGSSVKDIEMLDKVCKHIIREYNKGNSVVVVVSAQGKTTNNLIEQEQEITEVIYPREHDVLVSVGEQITISKLCMMLNKKGYKAISYTGWQLPIITNNDYTNANIVDITTNKIVKKLEEKYIVVVAGFQGVTLEGDITTLGRGGSDTTAVYLAGVLEAEKCEIYTDVDGVYMEDPNEFPDAMKYEKISYEEMKFLANMGAKVLHYKCVEVAKKFNVIIDVKSTFENGEQGTIVK